GGCLGGPEVLQRVRVVEAGAGSARGSSVDALEGRREGRVGVFLDVDLDQSAEVAGAVERLARGVRVGAGCRRVEVETLDRREAVRCRVQRALVGDLDG